MRLSAERRHVRIGNRCAILGRWLSFHARLADQHRIVFRARKEFELRGPLPFAPLQGIERPSAAAPLSRG